MTVAKWIAFVLTAAAIFFAGFIAERVLLTTSLRKCKGRVETAEAKVVELKLRLEGVKKLLKSQSKGKGKASKTKRWLKAGPYR